MFRLLLIWLVEFLLLAGSGSLFQRLVLRRFALDLFQSFWLGMMVVVALLQFWNLVLPINEITLVVATLAGLAGLALRRDDIRGRLLTLWERWSDPDLKRRILVAMGLALMFACAAAARTAWTRIVPAGDSFNYHLNIVRWAKEYPVVPGIVNLHMRLAFNTAYLLYAALIDNLWGSKRSIELMPGFLVVVTIVRWCFIIIQTGRIRRRVSPFFALLSVPYLIKTVSSLSPSLYYDVAPLLVAFVLAMEMIRWWEEDEAARMPLDLAGGWWIGLATLAVTFKISGAPHLALTTLLVIFLVARERGPRGGVLPRLVRIGGWPSVLFSGYLARNVIMSGWLLYPLPVANLHLPWAMPEAKIRHLYEREVRDWARMPGPDYVEVEKQGFWYWFPRWDKLFRRSTEKEALWAGSLATVAWLLRRRKKSDGSDHEADWVPRFLLTAAVADMVLWFTSAPDLRFGDGLIWLWFALALGFALQAWLRNGRVAGAAGCVLAGYFTLSFRPEIFPLEPFNLWDIPRVRTVPLKKVVVPNGQTPPLEIYMPDGGDKGLGDSPLPASPLFNPHLEWRQPGSLRHGFRDPDTGP